MSLKYKIAIENPSSHRVQVTINTTWPKDKDSLDFFLPVWSPGSYLVREYSKNIITFKATSQTGEDVYFEKMKKNVWSLSRQKSQTKSEIETVTLSYCVYAFELSVRTSFVNDDHAFLHLPDLLMGCEQVEMKDLTLEIDFPAGWTKLHTGLKDISKDRQHFIYSAPDYDELIDSPIEIGCHDSTGFKVKGIDHHVIAYGKLPKNYDQLVKDMKTVTESVCDFWGEIPYEHYTYMTHFIPGVYGGLEHLNSTAMQFDPHELETREGQLNYLGLVSHEFFHTWNVKRIRPAELVDFNYNEENYTRMHWLTEGLTSFVDDLIMCTCDVSTDEEYASTLQKSIQRLENNPGRKFVSLEDSSYDTWIKLYRPNENSANSTTSYYLKGDLVFFCLSAHLLKFNKTIKDFCAFLWKAYKDPGYQGITKEMVLNHITELSDEKTAAFFDNMLTTTEELPIDECAKMVGLEVVRSKNESAYLGCQFEYKNNGLWVKSVVIDGPFYKGRINARDEIIAADGVRLNRDNQSKWIKTLKENQKVNVLVSRYGELREQTIVVGRSPDKIENVKVVDRDLFKRLYSF